ncbi:N-acetyltransferase GCN5 [Actinorhabdospora filicis]|uniref:N-acetyltransferase GCN5 n=1 Tax=Actinorhabdospora filicis TaxID=1785913 RepID=A0A9W6SLL0_9ACTN|nr:GNAT family N-acetyltransferase [Actinorhabdospora filicis]GLZ78032.1 N-acetyltransferase GCN5 [Actinorhabdospora filicis]
MGPITVRAADPDDGMAIAAVQKTTWQATYGEWIPDVVAGLDLARTALNWSRAAADARQRVAVAEGETGVLGFAWSGPPEENEPEGTGVLLALYVHPEAQGRGAGRLLLDDAVTWLRAQGYTGCVVWALERYAPARRFYERSGFAVEDATRPWRGLAEVRHRRDLR